MNDNVAAVYENPITQAHPFDRNGNKTDAFQIFPDMFGHSGDMALRGARCNDHVIGKLSFAGQINDIDVLGLVVIK